MKDTQLAALNPPPHICGKMRTTTPPRIRAERLAWVAALPAKTTGREVAAALGISQTTADVLCRESGKPYRKAMRSNMQCRGLRWGVISHAVLDLPEEAQDRLEDIAAKRGITIAAALATAWMEARA